MGLMTEGDWMRGDGHLRRGEMHECFGYVADLACGGMLAGRSGWQPVAVDRLCSLLRL